MTLRQEEEMTELNDSQRMQRFPSASRSFSKNKRSRVASPMPRSSTMGHPVEDINQAARNIVDGEYGKAATLLTKTLKKLKLILSGDAKVVMPAKTRSIETSERKTHCYQCGHKHKDSDFSQSSCSALQYDFFDTSAEHFVKTSVPVQEHDEPRFKTVCVFTKPLVVNGDYFGVSFDARLCQDLSCVVMFNLALSHQLEAIELSKSSTGQEKRSLNCLQKSMNLYGFCQQMINNHSVRVRDPAVHCMALVSNLGQIHHLLGDSKKERACNEYLLSVLMYTIDGRKDENPIYNHLVFDGFLSIVEHLVIAKDCTAPAA